MTTDPHLDYTAAPPAYATHQPPYDMDMVMDMDMARKHQGRAGASHRFTAYPMSPQAISYAEATGPVHSQKRWAPNVDGPAVLLLTLLCAFTRLYQIGKRAVVTWDESHFGKFGAYYINRT
ncbi:Protein O-mannosyltransferase 2, partial [Coemansia sp. Benny D115]